MNLQQKKRYINLPQGIELMALGVKYISYTLYLNQRGYTVIMFVLYYSHLGLLNLSRWRAHEKMTEKYTKVAILSML